MITRGFDAESLIELSGASWRASQRVRTKDLLGSVKLASGTIDSPIAFIEFELPSEYAGFELEIRNFIPSAADVFALVLSLNGGSTYITDNINFDAYIVGHLSTVGTDIGTVSPNAEVASDAVLEISGISVLGHTSDTGPSSPLGISSTLKILP